jgi:hypothetical protein
MSSNEINPTNFQSSHLYVSHSNFEVFAKFNDLLGTTKYLGKSFTYITVFSSRIQERPLYMYVARRFGMAVLSAGERAKSLIALLSIKNIPYLGILACTTFLS